MVSKHPLDLVLVLGEEHHSVFAVTKRNNVSLMTKWEPRPSLGPSVNNIVAPL